MAEIRRSEIFIALKPLSSQGPIALGISRRWNKIKKMPSLKTLLASLRKESTLVKMYLLLVFFLAFYLRFYKLDWGDGFFFHPDERNIAAAVSRLRFPQEMNPKFFAYGGLPIYLYYGIGIVLNRFTNGGLTVSFTSAILIGRFISALFSVATCFLIYKIAKKVFNRLTALIALLLVTTTVGLIQIAHFMTTEAALAFFLTLIIWLSLEFLEKNRLKDRLILGLVLGLALATKITALFFIVPIIAALFFQKTILRKKLAGVLQIFLLAIIIAFALNPFYILDFSGLQSSLRYEIGVGRGKPIVFYTWQFLNTRPFIFQAQKVFPYVLGWPLFIAAAVGFFYSLASADRKNKNYIVLTIGFLAYLIPNLILFAKWCRFLAPIFPFFPHLSDELTNILSLRIIRNNSQG